MPVVTDPSGGGWIASGAHGIWFGGTNGSISLDTPATGIKQMAHVGSGNVTPTGGCH